MPARNQTLSAAALAALVIALDQLTKTAVSNLLGPSRAASRINIFGNWLALEYAENRGVAFGWFQNIGPLLTVIALLVIATLLIRFFHESRPPLWQTLAIGAIVGGAVGNLLDRLRYGYVIDFLAVGRWPNFNVADGAITIGVLVLIVGWMRLDPRIGSPEVR